MRLAAHAAEIAGKFLPGEAHIRERMTLGDRGREVHAERTVLLLGIGQVYLPHVHPVRLDGSLQGYEHGFHEPWLLPPVGYAVEKGSCFTEYRMRPVSSFLAIDMPDEGELLQQFRFREKTLRNCRPAGKRNLGNFCLLPCRVHGKLGNIPGIQEIHGTPTLRSLPQFRPGTPTWQRLR